MNWKFAEIIYLDNSKIQFKTIKKSSAEGFIKEKDLKWALKNKSISEKFNIGDIILIKKKIILGY